MQPKLPLKIRAVPSLIMVVMDRGRTAQILLRWFSPSSSSVRIFVSNPEVHIVVSVISFLTSGSLSLQPPLSRDIVAAAHNGSRVYVLMYIWLGSCCWLLMMVISSYLQQVLYVSSIVQMLFLLLLMMILLLLLEYFYLFFLSLYQQSSYLF